MFPGELPCGSPVFIVPNRDVYKRQGHPSAGVEQIFPHPGVGQYAGVRYAHPLPAGGVQPAAAAVSYTHLDVYKRQATRAKR